ncbi:hypothetical protein EON63_01720 [archaeon]|nr:MAG: hypothetical protein EON63_01720 [archaeon]
MHHTHHPCSPPSDHPNIRLKELLPTDSTRITANHEGPFGIQTEFADESMYDLLQVYVCMVYVIGVCLSFVQV